MSANVQSLRLRHSRGEGSWSDGPVRIGRAPDNELVLQDESLSRHHVEIQPTRHGWVMKDLGSANGVWHEGRRVPNLLLRVGDVVLLGAVAIEVLIATVAARQTLTPLRGGLALGIAVCSLALYASVTEPGPAASAVGDAARLSELRTPLPPKGMTASKAILAARAHLKRKNGSGLALVHARHAVAWGRALDESSQHATELDVLDAEVEAALNERFALGTAAFIRARKLGDRARAEASLRMLRETFPRDDPRVEQVNRLERRYR